MFRKLNFWKRRLALALQDAWDSVRAQKVRVGLSFLAIAVGIGSLNVLVAVLGSLQDKSRRLVQDLGVNVVGILGSRNSQERETVGIQERHAVLLASNLPDCAITTLSQMQAPTHGTTELLTVAATDDMLIDVRQWKMEEGRFLDRFDLESRERNAVVSRSLSKLWNWNVGNVIMVRDVAFRVVGVVAVGGDALGNEVSDPALVLGERVIFVPKTIPRYWASDQNRSDATVDAIFIRYPPSMGVGSVASVTQRLLSQPGYEVRGISWVTPESLTGKLKQTQKTITVSAGSIVLLCLVLGGTTLMSLMIASVRERIGEIGLRRAMGASEHGIAALFIAEACLVTGVAGLVAGIVSHVLLLMFRGAFPEPLDPDVANIARLLFVAIALGAAFSWWPARMAARIAPSEALRNE